MSDHFDEIKKMMHNKPDRDTHTGQKIDIICHSCGKKNSFDSLFCEECGASLQEETLPTLSTTIEEVKELDQEEEEIVDEKPEIVSENTIKSTKELENSANQNVIICSNCKKECDKEDAFCNKCGTKLVQEPPKCPSCGFEYKQGDDAFCRKCGYNLQAASEEHKTARQIKEEKLYCDKCGTEYKAGESFCGECGAKLSVTSKSIQQSQNTTYNSQIHTSNDGMVVSVTNTSNSYTPTNASQYEVKCPFCGSSIPRYTKKCPHCGEWLSGVSHFGCGSFLVLITTIIAICLAAGGESVGIPLIGEIGGIWLIVTAFLYFLPSLISDWRGHDSKFAIFIVNLFFGWTLIGWFAALIFSFTGRSR